ncbi:MAG: hypothetical protein QF744_15000 [SAR202 cluster bacterium]|jgi:hypothetical protein|nr:hypothetical protein [SAR202 cluster bacterium]
MANSDNPFGLRPIRHRNGAPYNGAVNPYYIPSSYGTALFIGDAVIKTGTSNTAEVKVPGGGSFPIGTMPEINAATVGDGNRITGVIVSFAAMPATLSNVHNPASTERVAYVCDDPDVVFEIQADGAIPAASIGLNAVLIATHSGSSTTGLSGLELDTTSDAPAADASNQLLILRACNREDNDTTLTHAKVEVLINKHTETQGTVGTLGL